MLCPKCGFSQPDDYYCANCGVNIDRYVQKKKKKGYAFAVAIVFLGIVAIAVIKHVQTLHRTEKAKTVSETAYDKGASGPKQPARIEPEIQRTKRTRKARRTSVTGRPGTKSEPPTSRTATKARSEREVAGGPPEKVEGEVGSQQKETTVTARQWFEKGRALDDDSELEMESYRKATELDPKLAPAYYCLGAIYYRRADYEQAEVEFIKFLQYASEEERLEYDIYLYYSDEDLEGLLELGKPASSTPEETSVGADTEGAGEEAEEDGPESVGEEAEEESPEGDVEIEEEVQTIVRFRSHNGQILVPVVLNGTVTANVLLDTGSGMTIISTELARDVGLKVARDRRIKLRTIAAEVQADLARLDSIELGDLRRDDFPVAVADLRLGEQSRLDGILGMDFLHNYAVHIDNANSRILLRPGSRR